MTGSAPRVYLDTNVFIAAFEKAGAHSDHALWILHAIEAGELSGVTSELTLSEVLIKPLTVGDTALTEAYKAMLTTSDIFEVPPVERSVLVAAAELRVWRPALKLPDAVHAATAIAHACVAFVSDDRGIRLPSGLRQLDVTPFTVEDILRPA